MPRGWETQPSGDEPVQFVIGMQWQDLWRLAARPWVGLAFARMLIPQDGGPQSTRLGIRPAGPVVVQRWPSRGAVDRWARAGAAAHAGAWARFRREVGGTADWGVWHEVGPAPG